MSQDRSASAEGSVGAARAAADRLARSFGFDACAERTGLTSLLAEDLGMRLVEWRV